MVLGSGKSLRLCTFAPLRWFICIFLVERSPEPELGFFPGDGGARVGLQVPETLLDKSVFRIRQCAPSASYSPRSVRGKEIPSRIRDNA